MTHPSSQFVTKPTSFYSFAIDFVIGKRTQFLRSPLTWRFSIDYFSMVELTASVAKLAKIFAGYLQ